MIVAHCVENFKPEYQLTIFPLPLPCDNSMEFGQTISYENEPHLVYIAAVRSHCRECPFHLVQQGEEKARPRNALCAGGLEGYQSPSADNGC